MKLFHNTSYLIRQKKKNQHGMVQLQISKSVLLYLTLEEYVATQNVVCGM